jgi:hypothetical protein
VLAGGSIKYLDLAGDVAGQQSAGKVQLWVSAAGNDLLAIDANVIAANA